MQLCVKHSSFKLLNLFLIFGEKSIWHHPRQLENIKFYSQCSRAFCNLKTAHAYFCSLHTLTLVRVIKKKSELGLKWQQ